MSIASTESIPRNRVPIHDPANAPLLDYIKRSAKSIQRTELTIGILIWAVTVVICFFTMVLIDHWIFPLDRIVRIAAWFGLVGGSIVWWSTRIVPMIGRTINPQYAARQIEKSHPDLKDGLISWVQLASRESTIPRSVLNTVGRYVTGHLKGQDVTSEVDQLPILKLASVFCGIFLTCSIYLSVSPKNATTTLARLLTPWRDIAAATRVEIVKFSPGSSVVTLGSSFPMQLQVKGWQPIDRARIRYSTDNGQLVDQRVTMETEIEGLTFKLDFGKSFGGIEQPLHYWVEAGDAVAGPFEVTVQAIPLVTLDTLHFTYPAYTRLASRTQEQDGRIEAPEGTIVSIEAHSNQPIETAKVEFDEQAEESNPFSVSSIWDLNAEDHRIHGRWIMRTNSLSDQRNKKRYRIRSKNKIGEVNPDPVSFSMTITPDNPPVVDFDSNVGETVEVPINDKRTLAVRANDPDYGLTFFMAHGKSRAGIELKKTLLTDPDGKLGQVQDNIMIDPTDLHLRVGDVLELKLVAQDNHHSPPILLDEPPKFSPQVTQSRVVKILVTGPIKKELLDPSNPSAQTDHPNSSDPSKNRRTRIQTKLMDRNPIKPRVTNRRTTTVIKTSRANQVTIQKMLGRRELSRKMMDRKMEATE